MNKTWLYIHISTSYKDMEYVVNGGFDYENVNKILKGMSSTQGPVFDYPHFVHLNEINITIIFGLVRQYLEWKNDVTNQNFMIII